MDNPVLAALIGDLPHLLGDPDLVQRLLDNTHARIELCAVRIDEAEVELEIVLGLRETPMPTEEDIGSAVDAAEASLDALLRQSRKLTQVLAFLLLVRALAYARSRSRLFPGVLLAAASAAVFPGFRTLVRLSVLTLGFLFASDRPPAAG